ncbi:MAG: fumarylacetoacetate hydrolase family protein [Methyloligellaceae bacterium]
MKLVTFIKDNEIPALGALLKGGKQIADLQAGATAKSGKPNPYLVSMIEYVRGGRHAFDAAQEALEYIVSNLPANTLLPITDVKMRAPLPVPESIRACMAFEEHIINCTRTVGLGKKAFIDEAIEKYFGRKYSLAYRANKAWYERPVYYKSNRFSVVGHGAKIRTPSYCTVLDYELEWGVVIGKTGKDIKAKDARNYIAGYTIFNDFSARNIQKQEMPGRLGPAKGKDFDTGNAIGPCLVTPDEIENPYDLEMTATINGEQWSKGNSRDMYWTFEQIIEYISQSETLYPGEFISSGTCSGKEGKGCGLEHGKFLKPGDVVELYVQNIGTLRNEIAIARSE